MTAYDGPMQQTDPSDPVPAFVTTAPAIADMVAPMARDLVERQPGIHVFAASGDSLPQGYSTPTSGVQTVSIPTSEAPVRRIVEPRSPVQDQAKASVQSSATAHFNAPRARLPALVATIAIACVVAALILVALRRRSEKRVLLSLHRFITEDTDRPRESRLNTQWMVGTLKQVMARVLDLRPRFARVAKDTPAGS